MKYNRGDKVIYTNCLGMLDVGTEYTVVEAKTALDGFCYGLSIKGLGTTVWCKETSFKPASKVIRSL